MATKTFTIQGKSYQLSDSQVVKALKRVEPERIGRYSVPVNGQRYPLKQALSKAIRGPPVAFTSQVAYRILNVLGFDIIDETEGKRR